MADLDVGKLTSVDAKGDRINLIPAEVRGFFHKHRSRLHLVLLAFFLILPWTHINDIQTVFLNIPKREFALFGVLFRAHEVPLLFFVLGIVTLGLAFVTSIWGRIWCGWACPQTVFVETIYRRIEQWTEGNYIARRQLRDAPLSFDKLTKVSLKWFLFIVVSALIAHSFMAYFVGSRELISMMQHSPFENLTYFTLVMFFTGITLFDFAWFREQFCVIMCPYGRIQSLLLDRKSLVVAYDVKRGEPRKGSEAFKNNEKKGDCVSCNRCVQVCPTGIDIRNGLQLECIACTACIDACDEIMTKVNKPTGLIKYDTVDGSKFTFFKPRSLFYLVAIVLLAVGLSYSLATRKPIDATLLRGKSSPYSFVDTSAGEKIILNQFRFHIQNQSTSVRRYEMVLSEKNQNNDIELNVAENPITLKPGQSREWFFFVRFQPVVTSKMGQHKLSVIIRSVDSEVPFALEKTVTLIGPVAP